MLLGGDTLGVIPVGMSEKSSPYFVLLGGGPLGGMSDVEEDHVPLGGGPLGLSVVPPQSSSVLSSGGILP